MCGPRQTLQWNVSPGYQEISRKRVTDSALPARPFKHEISDLLAPSPFPGVLNLLVLKASDIRITDSSICVFLFKKM